MLLRIALFAMLAVGIVGAGAVAWMVFAAPTAPTTASVAAGAPAPPAIKSVVLVAAHALRAGSLIKPEDLAAREIAAADAPTGASDDTPQTRGSLTGAMIRRSLGEGQPIIPADVVRPGDHGFLAAVLGSEMRAITVAVDVVSGTAGLIWPGDRVDLILTQALDDPKLAAGRRVAAETVLSDARVIAVDQQIVQGQAPEGTVAPANRTATLEVTPAQAERVLVAARLGKLSLSVLSADRPRDAAAPGSATAAAPPLASDAKLPPLTAAAPRGATEPGHQTAGVTWAGDVSPALGNGETRSAPVMVHVFQGGSESKEFHF
jgi:pilus assembly protein CpaB